jgi:hypothetical protein
MGFLSKLFGKKMAGSGPTGMDKQNEKMVMGIANKLMAQYHKDCGTAPERKTIFKWVDRLKEMNPGELLEFDNNPGAQKKFLEEDQ